MPNVRCDYTGAQRPCANEAHYVVEYTTPDDGKSMRRRARALRCFHHREPKFMPDGATQIEWSNWREAL